MRQSFDNLITNSEELEIFKTKTSSLNYPAILCSNYKADNPNFYGIIFSNNLFNEYFDINSNDIIGKSYDFLFENIETDYSTDDQLDIINLVKSIKNTQPCEIKQKIFNQKTLEKDSFKIKFEPFICESSGQKYSIFTFIKNYSDGVSELNSIKKENIALKNQILVRNLERSLNNEKILREISYQIISDKSVKDISYSICESICKILKVDHCIIHGLEEEDISFTVEYFEKNDNSSQFDQNDVQNYLKKQSNFHKKICANTDKTSIFVNNDVKNSPHYEIHGDFYEKYNIQSQICAISFFNNKANGGIYIHSSTQRNPTIDEVEMIEIIADQLSIAIERSKSIEKIIFTNHELLQKTKQLKKSIEKEKEAREMQAKFITLVSHEFKTPLQIIESTRELIARKIKSLNLYDESFEKYSARVKNAISRMTNLINSTLSLAKAEEADENQVTTYKTDFYLHDLLSEVVSKITDLSIKRNIDIQSNFSAKDDYINADSNLLEHCFSNIVSNSIKYSKKDSPVKITTNSDDSDVIVTIEDRGIGIPAKDLDRIGQKFFRSSNTLTESGTGIGLYLTKYFIELHNGSVKIDSEENFGTTVTISLPRK